MSRTQKLKGLVAASLRVKNIKRQSLHYRIRLRATQEAASLHIVGSSLQSGVLLRSQNRRHGLYEAGPTTDAKGKMAKKSDSHAKNLGSLRNRGL